MRWRSLLQVRFWLLACCCLLASAQVGAVLAFHIPENTDVVGDEEWIEARYEDTLVDLARTHGLGIQELQRANPGVDTWLPGEGERIRLPTRFVLPSGPRRGVVVNLAEYRLYYFPPGTSVVFTAPVGIGRTAFRTPTVATHVTDRIEQPNWTPPPSVRQSYAERGIELPRVVPPGADNPLGDYALMLDLPGYLIHGTNKRFGVGARVSHGCIRLYPEDIEELVWKIPVGTPVRFVHEPFKAGWSGDRLLVEAHPPLEEFSEQDVAELIERVVEVAGSNDIVDWDAVETYGREQLGRGVEVGRRGP